MRKGVQWIEVLKTCWMSLALLLMMSVVTVYAQTTVDIRNNEQDVVLFGEDAINLNSNVGDQLGVALAATGDFNGDGILDILVGANGADGPSNRRDHAGEVYAIFGKPSLPARIDVAGSEGQRPDVRVYGEEVGLTSILNFGIGDNLGEVITTGDINDDGYDDLIAAATLADGPGNARPDAGAVYVIFGRSTEDWDRLRPSSESPIIFDVAGAVGPKPDVTIHGADAADVLGTSLATGDVNDDGKQDLLVGACYADGPKNSMPDAGEVVVFFGRLTAKWQTITPIDLGTSPGLADVLVCGVDASDKLGSALASGGDVDGDGVDDIAIGARDADGVGNARKDAGEVYLLFGRDTTFWQSLSSGGCSAKSADVTITGTDAEDHLAGFAGLCMGNVNGDSVADLLIGTPTAQGPGNARPNCGEAYALVGHKTWTATLDLNKTAADVTIYGASAYDALGGAIASGDVDGDGIEDILVGAPMASGPQDKRWYGSGEAYVIYGRVFSSGTTVDLATPRTAGVTIYGAEGGQPGDYLGGAVTCGDVTGDKVDDVVVGAAYADGPNNTRRDAGEVYVIFGPQ